MNDKKYFYIMIFSLVLLLVLGVSYAWFNAVIKGNDTAKEQSVITGNLELTFTDDTEVTLPNAVPGDSYTKTISVKNTGTLDASYSLVWQELTNEITNDELVIEATCKRLNSSNTEEGTCESISRTPIKSSTIKRNISIEPSVTHEYTIKVTFIDTGSVQNYNKNKTFEGKLGITESSVKTVYCTYDGELTQGAEYVNGQYTYKYMQEGGYDGLGQVWQDITSDGWGVQLTDIASTDAVTSEVCTYINNKPITSMSYMFYKSQATTLDISNFNTSNVTDMNSMFGNSEATTLDVSNFDTSKVTNMGYMFSDSKAITLDVSNFDTSNVTNMNGMFWNSQATTLDVSNFDTSKVTDMSYMFEDSKATTLDLSNFDTSNVTRMINMFYNSQATTLDLSNFNTSNVKNMNSMFYKSQATTLDISNFNTSNVTDMNSMFGNSEATTIDVSNFDTSKVTNMNSMFLNSQAATLDLSNFDTSKVTNMSNMFYKATNLKTIYGSSKFVTTAVTSSTNMFYGCTKLIGGAGTKYNSSYVDKTYARIDGGTSNPGYFTDIADKPKEPESFTTDSWATISNAVRNGNIGKYNVGDTKTIDMGTYGTHTLRIANTSTPSECSTEGFSQTACGFVLEFADIITYHNMNPAGTYKGTQYDYGWNKDGWPASSMYTFVNNDIYNSLPSEIKNAIIDTTVVSGHGSTGGETNFTSTDKLYLLAPKEIYTDWSNSYDTAKDLTRTLDYYTSIGVTTSSYSGAKKKNGTNDSIWWLRAANSNNTYIFFNVGNGGYWDNDGAYYSRGVSPAFRLG